jgi:hypothetical protein
MIFVSIMSVKYPNALGDCSNLICYIILLLHAGQGNKKIYSPKSIIFPEGNMILVGEYISIVHEPACYECFIIPNETKKTHTCQILLANIF